MFSASEEETILDNPDVSFAPRRSRPISLLLHATWPPDLRKSPNLSERSICQYKTLQEDSCKYYAIKQPRTIGPRPFVKTNYSTFVLAHIHHDEQKTFVHINLTLSWESPCRLSKRVSWFSRFLSFPMSPSWYHIPGREESNNID
mmetsp:Transcript_7420/g.13691  ORF Transcript_7420/g.13691 Transcript_7420/m.13691 type:complete len:145 (+) Transcript_7420:415-849(+)